MFACMHVCLEGGKREGERRESDKEVERGKRRGGAREAGASFLFGFLTWAARYLGDLYSHYDRYIHIHTSSPLWWKRIYPQTINLNKSFLSSAVLLGHLPHQWEKYLLSMCLLLGLYVCIYSIALQIVCNWFLLLVLNQEPSIHLNPRNKSLMYIMMMMFWTFHLLLSGSALLKSLYMFKMCTANFSFLGAWLRSGVMNYSDSVEPTSEEMHSLFVFWACDSISPSYFCLYVGEYNKKVWFWKLRIPLKCYIHCHCELNCKSSVIWQINICSLQMTNLRYFDIVAPVV